jgi:hypothetical protein
MAVDELGHESYNPRSLTVTNTSPANTQNFSAKGIYRGADFKWDSSMEIDHSYYRIRTQIAGGSWGDWEDVDTNYYSRVMTDAEIATYGHSVSIYGEVSDVDAFENISLSVSSANATSLAVLSYTSDISTVGFLGTPIYSPYICFLDDDTLHPPAGVYDYTDGTWKIAHTVSNVAVQDTVLPDSVVDLMHSATCGLAAAQYDPKGAALSVEFAAGDGSNNAGLTNGVQSTDVKLAATGVSKTSNYYVYYKINNNNSYCYITYMHAWTRYKYERILIPLV